MFSQTNIGYNPDSLSILDVNLLKDFGHSRIKIKITRLKKGGAITIGAIRKDFFQTLNSKAPNPWNGAQNNGKVHFYNNHGLVFGQSNSSLKTFSEGSNMEMSMNGDKMKITMKKNSAEYKLSGGDFFFFFNLIGNAEVELKYLSGK